MEGSGIDFQRGVSVRLVISSDRRAMGQFVAEAAAAELNKTVAEHGEARLLIATGSSQFEVLEELSKRNDVPWPAITGFHLDEYIGLAPSHPASFCGYLRERFVDRVPLKHFHYLFGNGDCSVTMRTVGEILTSPVTGRPPIDVALVGIGENGHLAFNDPPADFETDEPYLTVKLDMACRMQQVGEGWFATLAEVPTHAISMSIRQIMRSSIIFCSVPDERKSQAVRNSVEGPVTPLVPASILQTHPRVTVIVDRSAASQLSDATKKMATSI